MGFYNRTFRYLTLGVVALLPFSAASQDRMSSWLELPATRSGIILTIPGGVNRVSLSGFQVGKQGPERKLLNETKWASKSTFVKQYRVSPGTYRLHFPGPVEALTINASKGGFVSITLERTNSGPGGKGVRITVTEGAPPPAVIAVVKAIAASRPGNAYAVAEVNSVGKDLYFSTDPPWPVPPPPKR